MEKYEVISIVGEGSYGLVMKCRHRESGQLTAIKKFLETDEDVTVRKMAVREIRMLKKLRHENLINLIEHFRRKKRFFLVFEYLEHTILEELEKNGSLDFSTSRKYIYQVLRALNFIHSNNVIHRDIKPENVLVSRLGVIKLCDFGFARPYGDNDTLTDYVATRWYRSPELLVGDPHYGKEVDIWSVGCLYAEIMTGEPLFPGDSDIDQLFQIVRVLGKLSPRHQILISRNPIFKGIKQEQNSSLAQLFPDWSRHSLDFLENCLKMETSSRPDTNCLLNDDLFLKDNFLDEFLPELKSKILQEYQGNPLLKRMAQRESGKKSNDGGKQDKMTILQKAEDQSQSYKEKVGQIGLTLNTTSNIYKPNNEELKIQFNSINIPKNLKPKANITKTSSDARKFERIVSAKTSIPVFDEPNLNAPTSPIQFQSLQTDAVNSDIENIPSSRNSPTYSHNVVAGSLLQYFNSKRKTNDIVGERKVHKPSLVQLQIDRSNVNKRDRNVFLKISTNSFPCIQTDVSKNNSTSPRLLQPPSWLVSNSTANSSHNKYSTGKVQPNKRGLTDWKSMSNKSSHDMPDFLLPNCSVASTTISPYKGKKKLSPMIPEQSSQTQNTPLNNVI